MNCTITRLLSVYLIFTLGISLQAQSNPPCSGLTDVVVSITVDNMPEETDFFIKLDPAAYPFFNTVTNAVDWANLPPDTTLNFTFNLKDGCHDFIINDSGNNGICCANGNGSYLLSIDGLGIGSGGAFSSADTLTFCTTAPTCSDGIQNGTETGIDCGGCCDPCSTCDDGIQNGDETAIDCGGSCIACNTPECSGLTDVDVSITVDNMPEETNYFIKLDPTVYPFFNTVTIGTDWASLPPDTTVNFTFNLKDGCHDFIITDSGNNGICCSNGNGSYLLSIDGISIGSGGTFTSSDTLSFCTIAPTCSDGIQNGTETGIDCGGCCLPCECADGIQNGDETGVDCGGIICGVPCPATCDDGIQNGDETGIDCGGSNCEPCSPCASNETEVEISIAFDNYPEDISWEVLDDNNNVLASGGNYGNLPPLTTIDTLLCIGSGCFAFEISDSFGDGLCCQYGDGSYSITVDGSEVAAGGQFGFIDSQNFCTVTCFDGIQNGDETGVDCGGTNCAPCGPACTDNQLSLEFVFDDYPEDISWTITNQNTGNVEYSGDSYTQPAGIPVVELSCLTNGCYNLTINDSYGDGLCCLYGNGSYSLELDGQLITTGSEFTFTESYDFCVNSGAVSTCSDGIQNGDETGIDCGGSCQPCCETEIIFDDFEVGFGNWNDGGNDCSRSANQNNAASGTYSIRIRDNSGIPSSTFTNSLDVSTMDQIKVSFTYRGIGMENGEDFWLQFSEDAGTTWQTSRTWINGIDFENAEFKTDEVFIDVSNIANVDLRFICDASGNNDRIFLDDIGVYSCSSTASREMLEINNIVQDSKLSALDSNNIKDNIKTDTENVLKTTVGLYPNPTKEMINLSYILEKESEVEISITNLSGKQLMFINQGNLQNGNYTLPINVSSFAPGIYILNVKTEVERQSHKFIVIQ